MKRKEDTGYNERLFSSGLRKRLHLGRFLWVRRKLLELDCPRARILELGCFDGKVIEFLPSMPELYVGYDADWEDALTIARAKWAGHPEVRFVPSTTPEEMDLGAERFDVALSMETLEHLTEPVLRGYLGKIAAATDHYLLITCPNEKGAVFFFKYLIKLAFGEVESHTPAEFVNATLGRSDRVERGHHKGFDYDWLIRIISEHFDVESVTGIPFSALPPSLNFTVGIVAKKKAP
jgi:Methyltransferase domain